MVEGPAISSVLMYCSSTPFAYFTRACKFDRKAKTTGEVSSVCFCIRKTAFCLGLFPTYYATFRRPFVNAFYRIDIRKKEEKHLKKEENSNCSTGRHLVYLLFALKGQSTSRRLAAVSRTNIRALTHAQTKCLPAICGKAICMKTICMKPIYSKCSK